MGKLEFRFSSAGAIALCPGRPLAESEIPEPEESDDATRGVDKHAVCSAHFTVPLHGNEDSEDVLRRKLSPEDEMICDTLIENTEEFIEEYGGIAVDAPILCEEPVEWNGWTGHPDFVALSKDRDAILLDDWKSGFSRNIPEAASNGQLRGYFVGCSIIAEMYGWSEWQCVIARINQPFGRPKPCRFTREDLRAAMQDLENIREAALAPDAPRIPSPDACRYCKALGTSRCPEGFGMGLQLMAKHVVNYADARPEWLVSVVRAGEVVKRIVDQAKDEIERRMLDDPKSVPNARLVEGDNKREIVNAKTVLARMLEIAPLPVLVEKGAVKLLLGGIKKVAGGKERESAILNGCIEITKNKPKVEL